MSLPAADVHRTVTFSDRRVLKQLLVVALVLTGLGVLFVSTYPSYHRNHLVGWLMGFGGIGCAIWAHFGLAKGGKALLTLSPQGLVLSSLGKDMFIPWHEVRGIDTVTFRVLSSIWTSLPPIIVPVKLTDVSVVLISRDFYEDHIVPTSPVLVHTPVWGRTFRSRGDNLIEVCLHHDLLPAKSEEIRREVAARWYAFREAAHTDTPDPASATAMSAAPGPAKTRRFVGDGVKFLVRWGQKPGR